MLQENVETQNMGVEINRDDAGRTADSSTESEVWRVESVQNKAALGIVVLDDQKLQLPRTRDPWKVTVVRQPEMSTKPETSISQMVIKHL